MLAFPLKDQVPAELKPYILDYWWDMSKLHALDLPTETVPIATLLWHLDLPWWEHGGQVFSLTPAQVRQEPEKYPEQYQRAMSADLQHPLTVRRAGGRVIIMDGIHRLLKAAIVGNQSVKIKVFSEQQSGDIAMQLKHPSGIDQRIVDKVVARRGRLHAFEKLEPATTALVVVDMDSATTRRMADTEIMQIIKPINDLAAALRDAGGVVAWVTTPIQKAGDNFRAIFGERTADMYEDEGKDGGTGTKLWHELDAKPDDLHVTKRASSALFPGKSNLDELLRERGIDTLLIVGVVTNVCCYATAIDGAALGYKVTMVSDAMQGQSYGLGEAHMATFFRVYGDVRPSSEVLGLIREQAT